MKRIINKNLAIKKILFLLSVILPSSHIYSSTSLEDREEYKTGLIRLSVKNDRRNKDSKVVYIYSKNYEQYSIIGFVDDIKVINRKGAIFKTLYTENYSTSYTLSKFERINLNKVINSLEKTLKNLNSDLENRNFAKCRYLDGFFPKFLKGFYKLSSLSFASEEALSQIANIDDSLYDVSLNSPKTDQRISYWQQNDEYLVKLRISITELLFQLKQWDKNLVIDSHIKDATIGYSKEFIMAYELFIKMYFNLK